MKNLEYVSNKMENFFKSIQLIETVALNRLPQKKNGLGVVAWWHIINLRIK